MTDDNRGISQEQMDELLNDMPNLLHSYFQEHLTDEIKVAFVTKVLSRKEALRVDLHLAQCNQCAQDIEHLSDVSSAWQGEAGSERFRNLSQRILGNLDEIVVPSNETKLSTASH